MFLKCSFCPIIVFFWYYFDAREYKGNGCDLDVICKYFSVTYKNQTYQKITCNIYLEHLEGSSFLVIKWKFSIYACVYRVIGYPFKIVNEQEDTVADKSNKHK